MGFLSASELAEIRGAVALGMPQDATVLRLTAYDDERGGQAERWDEAGTVACRLLKPGKTSDVVQGDAQQPEANHEIEISAAAVLLETDRLVIDGVTYSIAGPLVFYGYGFKYRTSVERV